MKSLKTKYWEMRKSYYNSKYQKYFKLLKNLKTFAYFSPSLEDYQGRYTYYQEKCNFYRDKMLACSKKI